MIETFGKYVIPEFDQDPVHLTDNTALRQNPSTRCGTKNRHL